MKDRNDIIRDALQSKLDGIKKAIEEKFEEIEELELEFKEVNATLSQLNFNPPPKKEIIKEPKRLHLDKSISEIALDAIKASQEPKTSTELYKSLKLNQMPKLDSFRTTLSKLVSTKKVTRQDGLYYITKKRRT